ncbi:hypothetical protein TNCV_1456831 [Trichonephila clavipes]|nr:hypothetical protein TNCV_1456831 [Trichonephila clavipes]
MICEKASIMVACDHPSQDNEGPQSTGRHYASHHHRILSMSHGWNQAINIKWFCRCSTDEHTFDGWSGILKVKIHQITDDLFPLQLYLV